MAQLAGQAELAERRQRPARRRPAARRARREATASAIARSAPGSSTRTPPATDTNTSAEPSAMPGVAGQHGQHQRQAVAVHAVGHPPRRHQLGGRHQRLHLHQQRPRALHRAQHHRARARGWPRPRTAPRRPPPPPAPPRASRTRPPRWWSRSGSSARAGCGRCARARPRSCSTQSTRCSSTRGPASAPSLVTWPTRITAVPPLLGHPHQPAGHLAHLAHRAGRAGERGGVQHLHRVDHAHVGPLGLDRGHHRVEVGLGHDRHLAARRRPAARPAAAPARPTPRPTRRAPCGRPRPGCPARWR